MLGPAEHWGPTGWGHSPCPGGTPGLGGKLNRAIRAAGSEENLVPDPVWGVVGV